VAELSLPEARAEAEALPPTRAAELADMLTALRKAAGHPNHAAGPLTADERATWGAADDLAHAAHDLPPALREAVRAVVCKYMERAEGKRADLDAVQWVQEAGLERVLRARAAEPEGARELAEADGAEESALGPAAAKPSLRELVLAWRALEAHNGGDVLYLEALLSREPASWDDAVRLRAAGETPWPDAAKPLGDALGFYGFLWLQAWPHRPSLRADALRARILNAWRLAREPEAQEPEEARRQGRDGQVAEAPKVVTNNFNIKKVETLAVQADSPGATQTVTRQSEPGRSSWWKWFPAWLVAVLKLLGLLLGLLGSYLGLEKFLGSVQ
jgi:hypothetical protein